MTWAKNILANIQRCQEKHEQPFHVLLFVKESTFKLVPRTDAHNHVLWVILAWLSLRSPPW